MSFRLTGYHFQIRDIFHVQDVSRKLEGVVIAIHPARPWSQDSPKRLTLEEAYPDLADHLHCRYPALYYFELSTSQEQYSFA